MGSNYSKQWGEYIPNNGINGVLKDWHEKQPPREQDCASPSTLLDCPRVVWLKKHRVPYTNDKGWGFKQRMLLGRIAENQIAAQLDFAGKLLWHWKDDVAGESVKFTHGEGLQKLAGTGDLLITLDDGRVAISDSKTSRADSFFYVPTVASQIFKDFLWYKYKIQVTAYYLLCHWNKDWFEQEVDMGQLGKRKPLPLPEVCHLFSYALDDGIVRREITWSPTREDAEEILALTKRWNTAYQSETMPDCLCGEPADEQGIKFCDYGHEFTRTKSGYKLATACCSDNLIKEVK